MAHPHPSPFVQSDLFGAVVMLSIGVAYVGFLGALVVSAFAGFRVAVFTFVTALVCTVALDAVMVATRKVRADWLIEYPCLDRTSCSLAPFVDGLVGLALAGVVWFFARRRMCGLDPAWPQRAWLVCVKVLCVSSLGVWGSLIVVNQLDVWQMVPFHEYTVDDGQHIH